MKEAFMNFLFNDQIKLIEPIPIRIIAIGSSPRGQFVAVEEFGFDRKTNSSFSRIKVVNVKSNKVMTYICEAKEENSTEVSNVRSIARKKAYAPLREYNIAI